MRYHRPSASNCPALCRSRAMKRRTNRLHELEIMRGEAAPAPLVLQLVERVLAVCPIAIQPTERRDLAVERGHQRGVFPDLPIRPDLGKAEPRLSGVAVIDDRDR